jgi:protein AroM
VSARIGAITIGQSPRVDLTPDIQPLLPGVEIVERGALDDFSKEEIEQLSVKAGNHTLASRLRDGTQVLIDEETVTLLMQQAITTLEEEGVAVVLVLCTGSFPQFSCSVPVLFPEKLFQATVKAIYPGGKLGVLTPHEEQLDFQKDRWSLLIGESVVVEAVSPYEHECKANLRAAAEQLRQQAVTMIALDCIGYTRVMRDTVWEITQTSGLLPRTVLARITAELLGL